MKCQDFREILELYADDQLIVETAHAALLHTENCDDCRRELNDYLAFQTKLRRTVENSPEYQINPAFEANLRERLYSKKALTSDFQSKDYWHILTSRQLLVSAGAALFLLIGVVAFFQFRTSDSDSSADIRENKRELEVPIYSEIQRSPADSAVPLTISWRETLKTAVGKHESCTLERLVIEHNPVLEKYDSTLPPNQRLAEIIRNSLQSNLSERVKLVASHLCESDGKQYTHLIYQTDKNYLSILLTNSAGLTVSDDAMFCESTGNYQVACFTTHQKTIFVISDLPEPENLKLARNLSPKVKSYLTMQ